MFPICPLGVADRFFLSLKALTSSKERCLALRVLALCLIMETECGGKEKMLYQDACGATGYQMSTLALAQAREKFVHGKLRLLHLQKLPAFEDEENMPFKEKCKNALRELMGIFTL